MHWEHWLYKNATDSLYQECVCGDIFVKLLHVEAAFYWLSQCEACDYFTMM